MLNLKLIAYVYKTPNIMKKIVSVLSQAIAETPKIEKVKNTYCLNLFKTKNSHEKITTRLSSYCKPVFCTRC